MPNISDARSRLSAIGRQTSEEVRRQDTSAVPSANPATAPLASTPSTGTVVRNEEIIPQPPPEPVSGELVTLALEDVLDSPFQPRRRALAKKDVEDLMLAIGATGQTTPIIVTPAPGDKYYVHAGKRRCAALRFLGAKTVLAIVRTDMSEREARRLTIVENFGRQDLTAFEEAVALRDYCNACGVDTDTAANDLGLRPRTAFRLTAILAASEELAAVIQDQAIPAKPAALLVRLESRDPKRAMRSARRYVDGKATSADIENALRDERGAPAGISRAIKDVDYRSDERRLKLSVHIEKASLHDAQRERIRAAIARLLADIGIDQIQAAAITTAGAGEGDR